MCVCVLSVLSPSFPLCGHRVVLGGRSVGQLCSPVWRALWLHGAILRCVRRLQPQWLRARLQARVADNGVRSGRETSRPLHVCASGDVSVPETRRHSSHGEKRTWNIYFLLFLFLFLFHFVVVPMGFLPQRMSAGTESRKPTLINNYY